MHPKLPSRRPTHAEPPHNHPIRIHIVKLPRMRQRLQKIDLPRKLVRARIPPIKMNHQRILRCHLAHLLAPLVHKRQLTQRLPPTMKPRVQSRRRPRVTLRYHHPVRLNRFVNLGPIPPHHQPLLLQPRRLPQLKLHRPLLPFHQQLLRRLQLRRLMHFPITQRPIHRLPIHLQVRHQIRQSRMLHLRLLRRQHQRLQLRQPLLQRRTLLRRHLDSKRWNRPHIHCHIVLRSITENTAHHKSQTTQSNGKNTHKSMG